MIQKDHRIDWYTIEPNRIGDGFVVYAHGEYLYPSVNEGRAYRAWKKHFDTVEEAQANFPDAEVLDHSTKNDYRADPGPVPPSWYDPEVNFEPWDEPC